MTDLIELVADDTATPDDDEFESPNGSEWIIGVDLDHRIFIVKTPNINPSFFDHGYNAEYMGWGEDWDVDAGLYKVIASFWTSTEWESGIIDDYGFEIRSFEKIELC